MDNMSSKSMEELVNRISEHVNQQGRSSQDRERDLEQELNQELSCSVEISGVNMTDSHTEVPGDYDYFYVNTPKASEPATPAFSTSSTAVQEWNSTKVPMMRLMSAASSSRPPSSVSHHSISTGSNTNGSRHSTSSACGDHHNHKGDINHHTCRIQPTNAPSSHYYIDENGRLRARRMWQWYVAMRRFLCLLVPWFKHDSNTFLCAPMISNTLLIFVVYTIHLLKDSYILPLIFDSHANKGAGCHNVSQEFIDIYSYTLVGNVLLCLPALNFSVCKLFKKKCKAKSLSLAAAGKTGSNVVENGINEDEPQFEKTYLFTFLELIVIFEIPYLIVALILLLFSSSDNIFSLTDTCFHDLPFGYFLVVVFGYFISLVIYYLRWKQIIIFHKLHEHILFQRGSVPGRARFDYVESSFYLPLFASKATCRVHQMKAALYHAAKFGEVEEVRQLVEEAIELDGPDFSTKWYSGHAWQMRECLLFARCQRNPLHVAIVFDQVEVVQELLSNGHFDVHQMEKMELLKINVTWVYRFLFEIISVLQRSKCAEAKSRQTFGPVGLFKSTLLTPLHVAVTMGNSDMVLLLLRYGADPNQPALSSHRKYATPSLFWATNKECTRYLLDADANPLYIPGKGLFLTPFEVARLLGHNSAALQMEKYGGDVALTPLHDACSKGFKQEVKFYLEHGANPNALGEQANGYFRRTPLHWAAMRGQTGAMKVLLRYGAEVDAKDIFGRTPLTWACVLNRTKAVELLLAHGADSNVRDIQGVPLLCVCAAGVTSAMASTKLSQSNREGNCNRIGAGYTGENQDHGGVEQTLARSMDTQIFQLLIEHGVDMHATKLCNGDTALHVALRKNNESAAIMFVRAGMSLTATNFLGERALECTTSPSLRYAIKKEAGQRDVMISYCHSHTALARKLRDALESAHVTTWIDSMDPSGITGGSIWRQEIAQGIKSSALVLAVLTQDYPASQWCMKELAFAKMQNVPVVAIQCEDMEITEELQVYLWTRQIIDFRPAVKHNHHSHSQSTLTLVSGEADTPTMKKKGNHAGGDRDEYFLAEGDQALSESNPSLGENSVMHTYDDEVFRNCIRLLLDGIHDQIEEHRIRLEQRRQRQPMSKSKICVVEDFDDQEAHDSGDESDRDGGNIEKKDKTNRGKVNDSFVVGDFFSSAAMRSLEETSSFVYIAHGDFHKGFCQRIKNALTKQGIRCVVDQAVPSVQYSYDGHPGQKHSTTGSHLSGASNSVNESASLSIQARQLAAKDAILACSAVIVVLSPISSKCDMLADQLAFAEDRGKLIIPLLLSLHTIDLAKRYTFSRSIVQHFNVSIGFEQSADRLISYIRVQTDRQRRRSHQSRGGDAELSYLHNSPMSSVSSAVSADSRNTPAVEIQSPSDISLGPADPLLLPPAIPVTPRVLGRRPGSGGGGHGWSASSMTNASNADAALLYQQDHLHHDQSAQSPSPPLNRTRSYIRRTSSMGGRRPSFRHQDSSSTRTTDYLE